MAKQEIIMKNMKQNRTKIPHIEPCGIQMNPHQEGNIWFYKYRHTLKILWVQFQTTSTECNIKIK